MHAYAFHYAGGFRLVVWPLGYQDLRCDAAAAQDNHIYTSGATGTNAAVIRGALRAEKPDLLTVVLPQSRSKQPPESQELLEEVWSCLKCTV